jgi:hypothetical protein
MRDPLCPHRQVDRIIRNAQGPDTRSTPRVPIGTRIFGHYWIDLSTPNRRPGICFFIFVDMPTNSTSERKETVGGQSKRSAKKNCREEGNLLLHESGRFWKMNKKIPRCGIFYYNSPNRSRTCDQTITSRMAVISPRHQPWPILERLRQMIRPDALTPGQICNGARQL